MAVQNQLEFASATDAGVVRKFNEDSIFVDEGLGLAVLADGMGGYMAGDVASAMATSAVMQVIKTAYDNDDAGELAGDASRSPLAKRAVEKANQAILKLAAKNPQYQEMGTTVVMALFHDDRVTIASVGDSRLYRLRYDRLQQLTVDHSLLQDEVEAGVIDAEEAKISHNRNLVTRALGKADSVEIDLRDEDVLPGDIYLLCSDGLNDMVEDADIELALVELKANLPLAAKLLVQMANDNGGHDNVSVILAQLQCQPVKHGLLDGLFGWFRR
jgi:protein phosphatase